MITACLVWAKKIALEDFRLPRDGRKWRQACRSRRALFLDLASRANEDGTFLREFAQSMVNFSPSYKKLRKHYANGSLNNGMNALRQLGFLSWTREKNHYARRVYEIHDPKDAKNSSNIQKKQFQDSHGAPTDSRCEHFQDSQKQVQRLELVTVPASSTDPSLQPSVAGEKNTLPLSGSAPSVGSTADPKSRLSPAGLRSVARALVESSATTLSLQQACDAMDFYTRGDPGAQMIVRQVLQELLEKEPRK